MMRRRTRAFAPHHSTNVMYMKKRLTAIMLLASAFSTSGCMYSKTWDALSPFQDPGPPKEHVGDPTNKTLLDETSAGGSTQSQNARAALEVMGNYRSAQPAQPTYPVMQPAEVRLMWVPDHLNKYNDLVPAHYYYLKVMEDRWAVQDAFEMEQQLNASTKGGGGGGAGGATPWVYGDPTSRK